MHTDVKNWERAHKQGFESNHPRKTNPTKAFMKSRRAVDLENQKCPIRNVLDRIGDRWSLLVLLNLHEIGTMRFTVIKRAIDDISQRMLSQTLRRLE